MLKFVLHILVGVCDWFWRYAFRAVLLDLDPLCIGTFAHPVILPWFYLHLYNRVQWCFNAMNRSEIWDIRTVSLWLYICRQRCRTSVQANFLMKSVLLRSLPTRTEYVFSSLYQWWSHICYPVPKSIKQVHLVSHQLWSISPATAIACITVAHGGPWSSPGMLWTVWHFSCIKELQLYL